MLIIGSTALDKIAHRYYRSERELIDREPKDVDFVGTYEEMRDYAAGAEICYPLSDKKFKMVGSRRRGDDKKIVEFEIAWPGSTAEELIEIVKADPETTVWYSTGFAIPSLDGYSTGFAIPSLDVLYLLKTSHRFLRNSPHFGKTMRDWRAMRAAGARIRPEHRDFLKRREAETYDYGHPKLDVTKDQFFSAAGGAVKYTFDHDSIHEAVKHLARPAYTYFKPENSEVKCDRAMFEAAPKEVKLYSVLEEAYVLALERSQIPHPGIVSPRKSFDTALMKVCTSISSGWWREYAYENYHNVRAFYEADGEEHYLARFEEGVRSGLVKRA